MTPAPSSSSEATPPGLSVPVNNSANSGSVAALAAVLRECCLQLDLPTLAERRGLVFAARDQTKQLAPVSLWPDAAEHENEIYNHSK